MLVLVVQVLLGFDYRAVFESGFESLPLSLQYMKLGSLAAQLLVGFSLRSLHITALLTTEKTRKLFVLLLESS